MHQVKKFIFLLLVTTASLLLATATEHSDFKFEEKSDDDLQVSIAASFYVSLRKHAETTTIVYFVCLTQFFVFCLSSGFFCRTRRTKWQ